MRFFTMLVVLAFPALPALAEGCLLAEALKSGIRVTVKDGSEQVFRTKGRDVVAELPERAKNSRFDARQTLLGGLHVLRDQRFLHDALADVSDGTVLVGSDEGGTLDTSYKYAGKPPAPAQGARWTTTVKFERDEEGPSIGPQPRLKGNAVAHVVFGAKKTVDISGCAYRIIPVETTIQLSKDSRFTLGGEVLPLEDTPPGTVILTRRQIWFDDLGFAVTTKESGEGFDWGAAWGQGIIGIAAE